MKKLTKEKFIQDLSRLISYETLTSNLEQNKKALDFIVSKIDKRASVKRIKNNSSEILIASNGKTLEPDICYLVHVDVVAGRPDQFKMSIKDDVAYGRGVSDMKFSIPIGYELLNQLIENKSKLSFSLVITTDEEAGGYNGAQFLANKYGLKPKALLVPDGGDNFVFVNKSKGVCQLEIVSNGIPTHSSRIWEGKNAIEPIVKLCNVLLKRYGQNNKKETWKTTLNIGKISGGISTNQVCDQAVVSLDFRFPENRSYQEIRDEVLREAKKISKDLTIKALSCGDPTYVDVKDKVVSLFIKILEKSLKRKLKIAGTYGASDARHFAFLGKPILMIKPMGGDIHGARENININSCLSFYAAMLDFLKKLEQKKNSSEWHS